MSTPVQTMIDAAEEAAELIGRHIKASSAALPEDELIPWSLAFSQLQEAAQQLQKAVQQACTDRMLAVGGPLHGTALPTADEFSTPDAKAPGKVHTYKRVHLRFPPGLVASVAAYMG